MTRAQRAQSQTTLITASQPRVAFVGSGPGDPGLLTVRAADLILTRSHCAAICSFWSFGRAIVSR